VPAHKRISHSLLLSGPASYTLVAGAVECIDDERFSVARPFKSAFETEMHPQIPAGFRIVLGL